MSEPIYEDVQVPARYRPLLRSLQQGTFARTELVVHHSGFDSRSCPRHTSAQTGGTDGCEISCDPNG